MQNHGTIHLLYGKPQQLELQPQLILPLRFPKLFNLKKYTGDALQIQKPIAIYFVPISPTHNC